jgi:hypothetical protein
VLAHRDFRTDLLLPKLPTALYSPAGNGNPLAPAQIAQPLARDLRRRPRDVNSNMTTVPESLAKPVRPFLIFRRADAKIRAGSP